MTEKVSLFWTQKVVPALEMKEILVHANFERCQTPRTRCRRSGAMLVVLEAAVRCCQRAQLQLCCSPAFSSLLVDLLVLIRN